jgi:hypothetical protein
MSHSIIFYDDGTAEVTAKSILSGNINILRMTLTPAQYAAWHRGGHIQNVLGHLSASEREFLLSGITAKEWDDEFKEPEDIGLEESGE